MKIIIAYQTAAGRCPYKRWYDKLGETQARRIMRELVKVVDGHTGNVKPLGGGLAELKLGSLRVYWVQDGDNLVLLGGGHKDQQNADLVKVKERMRDYEEKGASGIPWVD